MTQRFLLKSTLRAASLLTLSVVAVALLILVLAWVAVIGKFIPWLSTASVLGTVYLLLGIVSLMMLFALVTSALSSASRLVSRLEVSEQGLDYLFWPYLHIRADWSDVQSIETRQEIIRAEVLTLKRATELSIPIAMMLRKRIGMSSQYFVPLNIWDAYPVGELKQALERYAPQLFVRNA